MSGQPIDYYELLELTLEQRRQLPAINHQPYFDDMIQPKGWFCQVCWDDYEITAWPCEPATKGGLVLADNLGLKAVR